LENEQQKLELEKLKQSLIERDLIIEQQDKRLLIDHETQSTQTVSLNNLLNIISSFIFRMKINHLLKYLLNLMLIQLVNYKLN
jgi:hypothetical protein